MNNVDGFVVKLVDVLRFVAKIVSTLGLGLKLLTSKEPINYLVLILNFTSIVDKKENVY